MIYALFVCSSLLAPPIPEGEDCFVGMAAASMEECGQVLMPKVRLGPPLETGRHYVCAQVKLNQWTKILVSTPFVCELELNQCTPNPKNNQWYPQ